MSRPPRGRGESDGPLARVSRNVTEILSLLILGLGFVAMFLGEGWFWLVWVVGFAVVLPLVGILTGEHEADEGSRPDDSPARRTDDTLDETSTDDALAVLRERYARGDLTEEQFERKVEALLETETPEAARERIERTRETPESTEAETAFEP